MKTAAAGKPGTLLDSMRLARGLLLQTLYAQYPHPLARLMLERQVNPFYEDAAALERDIEYLVGKGYLTRDESQAAGRTVTLYLLTSAGVDVVTGAVADPGVTIAEP